MVKHTHRQLAPWLIMIVFMFVVLSYERSILLLATTNVVNVVFMHMIKPNSSTSKPTTCDTKVLQAWPITLLQWSLSINSAQSTTYLAMGRWAIYAGCPKTAITWLSQAIPSPMASYELGQIYDATGNTAEAVRNYQVIPTVALTYIRAGRAAMHAENWSLAQYKFKLAVRIAPQNPIAHYALGESLLYNPPRDITMGITELQTAIQMGYTDPFVYSRIAHGYAMNGRYDQAMEILNNANLDNALANAIRGDVYLARGDPTRAVVAYQKSLQQEPDSARIYANLGKAYLESGAQEQAIQSWKRALEISPGFAPALEALQKVNQP